MESSLLPNILAFIAKVYPFNQLPTDLQRTISASIQIGYYVRGESIANDGDEKFLYVVRVGAVEQRKSTGTLRARLGPGDLFGFSWLTEACELNYTAKAIENTLLYMVPVELLRETVSDYEEFSTFFASQARVRLQSALRYSYNPNEKGLFMQPVVQVANSKIVQVEGDTSIRDAALAMQEQRRSSAVVMDHQRIVGIVTDRDMTKRVVAAGLDVNLPVSQIMSEAPHTVAADDLVLKAVAIMMQHNVRSLPVVAKDRVVGILTATDLVQRHSMQAVYMINAIYHKNSLAGLVKLLPQRQAIFESLVEGGARAKNIGQVMSMIADAFMRRLIQLAEAQLGTPPCEYSWMVAGSLARYEVQAISDQDNALILANSVTSAEMDYFRQMADFVCYGMAECGYMLCPGHIMATNPKWCQSVKTWQGYYKQWIMEPDPESLLNISVFMDIRHLAGSESLFEQVEQTMLSMVKGNTRFLSMMVANSIRISPPLGVFRNFVLAKDGEHRNSLNIKARAVNLIVELARIYALAAGEPTAGTERRLEKACEGGSIDKATLDDLLGAYQFISFLRLKQQRLALNQGKEPSNYISPAELELLDRNNLKDAFAIIADIQEAAELRFSARGVLR